MKLYFIGCRSAIGAVPGYMHSAFAVEINDKIYWFDAGEGCSYTAYLMGVDLLRVKEIFISHTHADHIGGLGNLIWNMRKVSVRKDMLPVHGDIGLHIAGISVWEGISKILQNTEGNFGWECEILPTEIVRGNVYKDEDVNVCAYHNRHLEEHETEEELSFSFEIESENKRIVYSGDVKGLSDLDEILEKPCDYLLIETGHQSVEEVCEYIDKKQVDTVIFTHHNKDVLSDITAARIKAQNLTKCKVIFAQDGNSIEI